MLDYNHYYPSNLIYRLRSMFRPTFQWLSRLISTHLLIRAWFIYFRLEFEHFVAHGEFSSLVCRLCKSLYGLKQCLKVWFEKYNIVILSHYVLSTLYIKFNISWERLSTLRLSVNTDQIQDLMRRHYTENECQFCEVNWSTCNNLTKFLIVPRINYICNKLGTWIVRTRLRGSVRTWISLYNPIRIGIGLYNPI